MLKRNLDQTYLDIESTHYEITHNKLKLLEKEHQLLFEQKELYQTQRARIQWLKDEDNNTKLFHAFAIICKRRNMIQSIKIDNN